MLSFLQVNVYYYQEADGSCPVRVFLRVQPARVQGQAEARITLLAARGHQLRRPHAALLEDGMYELRWRTGRVQYRILYCFHGRQRAVLLHALTKEGKISSTDLARARHRQQLFLLHPTVHTKP